MKFRRQSLLVSIRGKEEALAAIRGGAHIAGVEYPASTLGTPYPLNIRMVRNALPKEIAGFGGRSCRTCIEKPFSVSSFSMLTKGFRFAIS